MSTYFIGDIHGCYKNLITILHNINFNPDIDVLYLTGDLVARGPRSLEVLRWAQNPKNRVKTVLGNHDLYLLKTYFEINNKTVQHPFESIFKASDVDELMQWLRHQPMLYIDEDKKFLISHAGIYPTWNLNQSKFYAQEIEKILIGKQPYLLFYDLNQYNQFKKLNIDINQLKQIQHNLNVFTKMRYVHINGQLNLTYKDIPKNAPSNTYPWFNLSQFINTGYSVIFGHWATLKNINTPFGFYGLDSGCCWGGDLTVLRWEDKKIIRTPCSPPA